MIHSYLFKLRMALKPISVSLLDWCANFVHDFVLPHSGMSVRVPWFYLSRQSTCVFGDDGYLSSCRHEDRLPKNVHRAVRRQDWCMHVGTSFNWPIFTPEFGCLVKWTSWEGLDCRTFAPGRSCLCSIVPPYLSRPGSYWFIASFPYHFQVFLQWKQGCL